MTTAFDALFGSGVITKSPDIGVGEEINPDVFNQDWSCIISIVYDMTNFNPEDDYMRGCEYIDSNCITVRGDIQSEMYCHDLAPTLASDELDNIIDVDNIDESDIVPGMYRYVLGVRIHGHEWTSREGVTEYDEDYDYDIISKERYRTNDEQFLLDDLKKQEEDAQRCWAEQNAIEELKILIANKTITDPNVLRLFDNGITPTQP